MGQFSGPQERCETLEGREQSWTSELGSPLIQHRFQGPPKEYGTLRRGQLKMDPDLEDYPSAEGCWVPRPCHELLRVRSAAAATIGA